MAGSGGRPAPGSLARQSGWPLLWSGTSTLSPGGEAAATPATRAQVGRAAVRAEHCCDGAVPRREQGPARRGCGPLSNVEDRLGPGKISLPCCLGLSRPPTSSSCFFLSPGWEESPPPPSMKQMQEDPPSGILGLDGDFSSSPTAPAHSGPWKVGPQQADANMAPWSL